MAPKVSVIVPAYNVERYIAECLCSLVVQTFDDFEVLCIDDCSQDSTLDVARASVAGDGRFSFHAAEQNRGLSATRNWGIDHAQGDYLLFLDSDDLLLPTALELLVARAQEQDLDDLFFSAAVVYESDEAHEAHDEVFSTRTSCPQAMTGRELFEWFVACGGLWPQAPYHMVRRQFLADEGIRFYEGILHEDELYTVQTLCAAKRADYLDEQLYLRRVRMDSIMTTPRGIRNVAGVFRVITELGAWMDKHGSECSDSFVEAYAFNMGCLQRIMVHDALGTDPAELDAFAAGLPANERLDFYLRVRDAVQDVHANHREILDSATYRVGDALVRGPRLMRDRIAQHLGSNGVVGRFGRGEKKD